MVFPTNVEHSCLPIISGVRYVFKSQLHLPEAFEKLYKIESNAHPVSIQLSDLEPQIADYESQIRKYERKIEQISRTVDQLRQLCPSTQTLDIVDKIKKGDADTYIVVLDRYYDQLDPNFLIGEDRLLYNSIISLYPQTKLEEIAMPNIILAIVMGELPTNFILMLLFTRARSFIKKILQVVKHPDL